MFTVQVKPDSGADYEVKVLPRDVLKWERSGKDRSLGNIMQTGELRIEDLYFLAYAAAKREGLFTGSLSSFEDKHDVTSEGPDDEPDPTQKAR